MDAYQDLLNERNRLAAQVAAQAVEINALEQSTAVLVGKRLNRLAPLMNRAIRLARAVRNWHRKHRLPVRIPVIADNRKGAGRPLVMVLTADPVASPGALLAQGLMEELRKSYDVAAILVGQHKAQVDWAEAADLVLGPFAIGEDNYALSLATAESLAAKYKPRFAIVAGAHAAHLGLTLSAAAVPVIALMHEPPEALKIPGDNAQTLMDRADDVIFPSRFVQDLYRPFYSRMDYRRAQALTPGSSAVRSGREKRLRDRLSYIADDCLLVLGTGAVDYRNGVDIFVSVACILRNAHPEIAFHFVWAGTLADAKYSKAIDHQIAWANAQDIVTILYEPDESQTLYSDCDLVFAPARLDYLPNALTAYALREKPVICFAGTGGIAEIFSSDTATAALVLPHMDSAAATRLLHRLANDGQQRKDLGVQSRRVIETACDLSGYAKSLADLGEQAAAARSRSDIADLLEQPGNFDADLYAGKSVAPSDRAKIIAGYLGRLYHDGFRKRALAGFHPEYYASHFHDIHEQRSNPLTHFIQAGKPQGPWLHKIIRLDRESMPPAATIRTALHGHFYYVDHIGNLLQSLSVNRSTVDLFLTTGSEESRQKLLAATKDYKAGAVSVEIVPNKGRDIGPFLHLYRTRLHSAYDCIGHVHGKRSLFATWDPKYGDRWRDFLFEHLLGPKLAAMDIILNKFAGDPQLGFVFPEDPVVFGWDNNRDHAERLCERMGLAITLPPHIDFPIGTMFWARAAALAPLMKLDISWDEYPSEPLPVDGTILHALERLLPSIARAAGYDYAATYFPGVGR
jgi:glycosyltransferase involved in cell wall biosynthesis